MIRVRSRRVVYLVAGLVSVFALAACGGGEGEAPTPTSTPTVGAEVPAPTSTPTPEAASPTPTPEAPPTPTSTPTPTGPSAPDTPTPTQTAVAPISSVPSEAAEGTLEVRVTDAPPEGVSKILVTVSHIEVHLADTADEEGWLSVFEGGERAFDLVAVTGVEAVLGAQEFAAGKYTQVRMDVDSVVVTMKDASGEDVDKEATVPSDKLRIVRPFDVEAGMTTVLTLDFDADRSVVVTGRGDVQLKPVVKLLVRKEGPGERPAEEAAPTATSTATPTPTSTPEPTATAAPSPTSTPEPTATPTITPAPTNTPTPTVTPTPTATPDPVGAALFLEIVSPVPEEGEDIAYVSTQTTTIVGRTRIDAAVSVDDAFLEVDEDGLFQVEVSLEEGPNLIEVVVSGGSGEEQSIILVVAYEPEG